MHREDASTRAGRVLVFPGIYNVRFHLAGFIAALQRQLPAFRIEVRTWGTPLLPLYNLVAHRSNLETAQRMAHELTEWRQAHRSAPLYVVGYSGGGGIALLTAAALPESVSLDRLVLVAPAISPRYPLGDAVLPRVSEFVASYSSVMDVQVAWGTRAFGTIDRERTSSAGAVGFALDHERLLQWHWSREMRRIGHGGRHHSYLNRAWQARALLPALDPAVDAEGLKAHWASLIEGAGV